MNVWIVHGEFGLRLLVSNAMVKNLPRTHLDHHPILVSMGLNQIGGRGNRSFKVELSWLTRENFGDLLKEVWAGDARNILDTFKRFTGRAQW